MDPNSGILAYSSCPLTSKPVVFARIVLTTIRGALHNHIKVSSTAHTPMPPSPKPKAHLNILPINLKLVRILTYRRISVCAYSLTNSSIAAEMSERLFAKKLFLEFLVFREVSENAAHRQGRGDHA
ncbi:hypothetical protein MKZ38_001393 [Zalerion maritima]|uniref:Uncharacterized protein n=1 Tax=Zalerion maritima TaxID=339359 RepID=A0AAD5RXW3_9PEZI|nr:hypothetical protein MKZ38_001393 [Zalerion maritima]